MQRLRGIATTLAIQELAARQYWVVSRAQLERLGLSSDSVDRRIRAGLLQVLYPGVYSLGSELQPRARLLAAVLACHGMVVVSNRSAAGLWGLSPPPRVDEPVDLIGKATDRGRKLNVRLRRIHTLRRSEHTVLDGIPVTTPARTLLDLAALVTSRAHVLSEHDVDRAVNEALGRRLTSLSELNRLLKHHPRQPGSGLLRDILGARAGATRSTAEKRLLELVRKAELPKPEVNTRFEGIEVDFLWRNQRLVVEVDGFAFHATRSRFETDRRRDAALVAAGVRVARFTWRQLTREREATIARLAQALCV